MRYRAILLWVAILGLGVPPAVHADEATPPQPSYGSALVDGQYAEWDLTSDFFSNMYEAGNPNHPLESKLYLRYSCTTQTMCALVLAEAGVVGYVSAVDAWVAINTQHNKVVNGQSGNDGMPPDFSWVGLGYDGNPLHCRGYEASFPLAPGSYTIIVHLAFLYATGAQGTSGTPGFPNSGPALQVVCGTLGACCVGETCVLVVEPECAALGGAFHPEWATCGPPNPCARPHVCCMGEVCLVVLEAECAAMSGSFHPEWDSCTPNPCALPHACCVGEACLLAFEAECVEMGGVFHPEGNSCDRTNPCALPHVCCVGEDCYVVLETECATLGGAFHPEWDTCGPPNPCQLVPAAPDSWGGVKNLYR